METRIENEKEKFDVNEQKSEEEVDNFLDRGSDAGQFKNDSAQSRNSLPAPESSPDFAYSEHTDQVAENLNSAKDFVEALFEKTASKEGSSGFKIN